MESVNEMNYQELVAEVKYIVSLLDDQPYHHDAYLLELVSAMVEKSNEVQGA